MPFASPPDHARVLARFAALLGDVTSGPEASYPGLLFNRLFRSQMLSELATIVSFNAWDGPFRRFCASRPAPSVFYRHYDSQPLSFFVSQCLLLVYAEAGGPGHMQGLPTSRSTRNTPLSGSKNIAGRVVFRNFRGDPAVLVTHLSQIAAPEDPSTSQHLVISNWRLGLRPLRLTRPVVNWTAEIDGGRQLQPLPPVEAPMDAVLDMQGVCLADYRQIMEEKYLAQLDRILPQNDPHHSAIGKPLRRLKLAFVHARNSPLSFEVRKIFANLAARSSARLFNYEIKTLPEFEQPYIDRFQVLIHPQRWPPDNKGGIDMVLQPVDLGRGELEFSQLVTAYEWLLGRPFGDVNFMKDPKQTDAAVLAGIFSDPAVEVRGGLWVLLSYDRLRVQFAGASHKF